MVVICSMVNEAAPEPCDLDDDLPDLESASDDDLPPLDGEDQVTQASAPTAGLRLDERVNLETASAASAEASALGNSGPDLTGVDNAILEAECIRTAGALRAKATLQEVEKKAEGNDSVSAVDAMRDLLEETEEVEQNPAQPDEKTVQMVKAISKDDFEACEVAIMAGADINADCGAGMRALHITALRGETFLTELLIAHGANVNERDKSGNTPLLYACHFYRQHQRGVAIVSQLLHHKADPFFRIRDGKLAGKCAFDLMEKACNEPNMDENVPTQMKAMLQLAMDGSESGRAAITKMWVHYKIQNKKLYQVSSKSDKMGYAMKNIEWDAPCDQSYAPVRIDGASDSILEEKFTDVKDYLFSDEGEKVKVYITFPENALAALEDPSNLQVEFQMESFVVKLRCDSESFRLRMDPLFGTVDVAQCKHRISAKSRKVTLTLAKRHKNRIWSLIQKR